MYKNYDDYRTYESDDTSAGATLKIEHTVIVDETDMSDLISKPIEKLQAMRDNNVKKETAAFEKVQQAARNWEKHAVVTRQFERAIEYLKMPQVAHTSNKWVDEDYGYNAKSISNMVYKMRYSIYERSSWRNDTKKYDVKWSIITNRPDNGTRIHIAGQERTCNSKEAAEKYVQGRIKAYSHLFTEISPPIPKEYKKYFSLYGQLLPGYTVEGEPQQEQENVKSDKNIGADKKPSIRKELNSIKAAEKNKTEPAQTKKRSSPEL